MSKKALWIVVSILMALSLVMAACSPATTPTAPETPITPGTPTTPVTPSAPVAPTTPGTEKPQQEPVKTALEKPKYGGTFTFLQTAEILNFDPAVGGSPTFGFTNDTLTQSDWTKGPAGTGENDFMHLVPDLKGVTGSIIESWQLPAVGTFVFKVRRGIHYGLNPASEASRLVNGRELTAADIVFTIRRNATSPAAAIYLAKPEMSRSMSIDETSPWEITVKTPVDPWGGVERIFYGVGGSNAPQPPEVVQKYGNMNNWKNSAGAGAWILTDFVAGSIATLSRNQNYWETDPLGPGKGNQLPYVDTVKLLIVRDVSTQLAALRTGKVDVSMNVIATDAKDLKQTAPRLKYKNRTQNYPLAIGMRLDKPGLPYQDIRVRQALMMATDFVGLRDYYYGGEADLIAWPVINAPETKGGYHPLSELPESVQALWKYNPERAKQLLKEAGYPNGFKAKIIVQSTPTAVDALSAVKDMWSKVGVDLELQVKEQSTFATIQNTRNYDDMFFRGLTPGKSDMVGFDTLRGGSLENVSYVNDPKIEAVFQEEQKHILIDMPGLYKLYYDLMPYVMEQAWLIPLPGAWTYIVYQPWVKNYHGENTLSFGAGNNWVKYVWIDRDMKQQMTGSR